MAITGIKNTKMMLIIKPFSSVYVSNKLSSTTYIYMHACVSLICLLTLFARGVLAT